MRSGVSRDLLRATARHPAMLFYLDNWENSAPGSKMPNGREVGINENYARELMELHTLGVDGGYTQADVIALAQILTGWGLARPRMPPPDRTGFYFDPTRHQWGNKQFLGRDIAPAGVAEGEEALDMLAKHPATARHIAQQLARYFVADAPPAPLVERLAARFQESDGEIRAVLQTLVRQPRVPGQHRRQIQDTVPVRVVGGARQRCCGAKPAAAARHDGAARHAALRLPDARTATRTPKTPGSAPMRRRCGSALPPRWRRAGCRWTMFRR